jgi:hypothetical protein
MHTQIPEVYCSSLEITNKHSELISNNRECIRGLWSNDIIFMEFSHNFLRISAKSIHLLEDDSYNLLTYASNSFCWAVFPFDFPRNCPTEVARFIIIASSSSGRSQMSFRARSRFGCDHIRKMCARAILNLLHRQHL